MSSSLTTEVPPFVCGCKVDWRPVCKGLPFYGRHDDADYCVLHFPPVSKEDAPFYEAVRKKTEAGDLNFSGVSFHEHTSFKRFRFEGDANFTSATFDAGADFDHAYFKARALFEDATFGKSASFKYAVFNESAYFKAVVFKEHADFRYAKFYAGANFDDATFGGHVKFAKSNLNKVFEEDGYLTLQFPTIKSPENFSLRWVRLSPHWFANADAYARRFEFVNVEWVSTTARKELKGLYGKNIPSPHAALSAACRSLALNAEENHRYEEASDFRYMAMDARRLEKSRGFALWTLRWWYWFASGYGERVLRASVVLVGMLLLFAALYTQVGFVRWETRVANEQEAAEARRDEVGAPLHWGRALTYSLGVMTLQKPEPRPATSVAQALVMVETILGPVQAALLALAIRRKFMR